MFGQVMLGQVRLGQDILGQAKLGQVRLGEVRLGEVRLGQVRFRLGMDSIGLLKIQKLKSFFKTQPLFANTKFLINQHLQSSVLIEKYSTFLCKNNFESFIHQTRLITAEAATAATETRPRSRRRRRRRATLRLFFRRTNSK